MSEFYMFLRDELTQPSPDYDNDDVLVSIVPYEQIYYFTLKSISYDQ